MLKYFVTAALTVLVLVCCLQCTSSERSAADPAAQYALDQAIKYSGFNLSDDLYDRVLAAAEKVEVQDCYPADSSGKKCRKKAWRFVFDSMELMGRDSIAHVRSYEVLIDTANGYLLMIRSPFVNESIYTYNRDPRSTRSANWHRPSGLVPDTGIVTFVEALAACTGFYPLEALKLEAAVEYSGAPGSSGRAWDIVVRDIPRVFVKPRGGPRVADPETQKFIEERRKRGRWSYARQSIGAVSGAAFMTEVTYSYDNDTLIDSLFGRHIK